VYKNYTGLQIFSENYIEENDSRLYSLPYIQIYSQDVQNSLKMKLVNSAIKLYSNIFCSSHLSHKNRVQLCKHLQAHLAQPGDGNNKQFTIVVLVYGIIRHLAKTPSACELLPEPDQIFALLRSTGELACGMANHILRTLGCEFVALLHKAFNDTLATLLPSFVSELTRLSDSADVLSKSKAAVIVGYLFKHFELEKLKPFIKQLEAIVLKQLRDMHALSKFNGLFTLYLIIKYSGNTFPTIIEQGLNLCLHNYNTDIRLDKSIFALICRIFELLLRIKPALAQGKLPIIGFDCISLSKCNHQQVISSILQFIKYALVSGSEAQIIPVKQIVEIILKPILTQNIYGNFSIKRNALEILLVLINHNFISAINQVEPHLIWKLIDELNLIKSGYPEISHQYTKKQVKKLLKLHLWSDDINSSWNLTEKFETMTSQQTRLAELVQENEPLLYTFVLKQTIISLFKEIINTKGAIKEIIDMLKYIIEYRVLEEQEPGMSSPDSKLGGAINKEEGIVVREKKKDTSFKFKKAINIGMKCFMIKLLTKLIQEEDRESELIILLNQLPNLLSLAFSFINIQSNPHKDVAFKLVKIAIKKCKNLKDLIAPLNEEDESSDLHSGLEQFEAQFNTLIRQYMTKNSSYATLKHIFSIFYYFCSIPISRDPNTLSKLIQQLIEPLKELNVTGSAEFSCEKDALSCHLKRLKIICKLFFISSDIQFGNISLKSQPPGNLVSKFLKRDDKKRILELFKNNKEYF